MAKTVVDNTKQMQTRWNELNSKQLNEFDFEDFNKNKYKESESREYSNQNYLAMRKLEEVYQIGNYLTSQKASIS